MAKKKQKKQPNMESGKSASVQQKENKETKRGKIGLIVCVCIFLAVLFAIGFWRISEVNCEPSEKVVFMIGEEAVYLDEVNFCILQYMTNLGMDSSELENVITEGKQTEEEYKEQILDFIMDYHVVCQEAKKQGVELSKEDASKTRVEAVAFMNTISGSVANKFGITQECVNEVYRKMYLSEKMEKTVVEDVTVEHQNYCTMYLLFFPKVVMTEDGDYERQEDGTTPVMLSDDEINKRKQDADAAYEELKEGADVEEIAKKYGVDGFSGEESNMAESFGEPFSKYAASLKDNEYSPVIETESCYAILKMITANNQDVSDQIMGYYQADVEKDKIAEMKSKWYEELGIDKTPEFKGNIWKKISLFDYTQFVEK